MKKQFDVIIIGGSYAGLSAAMTLGRSLRKVLIIDSGKPCNRQTLHSHNFLTQDGETPGEIARKAKEQVLHYPTVAWQHGKVSHVEKQANAFQITTDAAEVFSARKVLFATGITDIMPPIPGFGECWGISVLHCPYCHGYEVHSKKIALIGNGDMGFELTRLIYNWSKDLTLFTNGASTLTQAQKQKIAHYPVKIIETPIQEILHENGYVRTIRLSDGEQKNVEAIFARVGFKQHCAIPEQMGCALTETGFIQVNEFGKTNIHGVFAAGDNSTQMRSVAMANASGNKAGAWINKELIEEDF